jgi:carboxyl-terminal processing protease
MNRKNLPALLASIALVVAACTGAGSATTSQPSPGIDPGVSTTGPEGSVTTDPPATSSDPDRVLELVECDDADEDLAIVCEAYDLIKTKYVDEVDDAALADAADMGLALLDGSDSSELLVCVTPDVAFSPVCDHALAAAEDSTEAAEAMVSGLAFALDPNSGYFDAQSLDLLEEEQDGEIQGIGALVSPEDQTLPGDNKQCGVVSATCQILIVSTIAGAPAEAAGLQRDDVLVGVDGESLEGWAVDAVTAAVRGPTGTDVVLTIQRDGDEFDLTITREAVSIPVIDSEVVGEVGYLRLWNFTGNASSEFEAGVVELLGQGVEELVIDLRDNPGGFLTTAIDVASVFKEEGDVVVTQGPDETTSYEVNGAAIVPEDMPVTFVVNKGSASASEVVAAALQEDGLVTVVGENTFGKNTVQQRFGLSNGGALKLTIARWLTPGGHDFGGTGVTPDVLLDVTGLDPTELVTAVTS